MESFIENLNGRGETFLTFVWPMLWQSSLLIAVLLAFDFLVRRKVRASVRYTLWLVVLVKLCLPPTLALPTSPAWWLHKTPPPIAAKPVMHYTVTYDDTTPLPEAPAESLPAYVPPKPSLTTAAWLLSASIVVSAMLLCWLLARWWHVTRLVRRAVVSERLTTLADEAQRIAGMRLPVRVKLTTNAMSPAVCGLFRPAILIPQPLAENFSDEQMRAVLLHELIHLRRRDVWMNFLQALLQIVYWWHPLVWLANARIRRVREEAVDDAVMLALHDGAEAYAPTLLEVAKLALNRPLVSLGLVGIMESRNALRQRIERLLDFHPPRRAGLTLVSLLGVLAFTAVAVPMGQGPVPAPANTEATPTTVTTLAQTSVTAPSANDVPRALADPNYQITLHELEAILTNQNFRVMLDEMEKNGASIRSVGAQPMLAETSTVTGTNLARILRDPNFRVALHALESGASIRSLGPQPMLAEMPAATGTNLASILRDPNFQVALREFEKRNADDTSSGTPPDHRMKPPTGINHVEIATQTSASVNTNVPQILITAYFCEALVPDLKEFEKSLKFNVDKEGQNLWATLPPDQFGPVHDRLSVPAFHRLSTPRVVTLNGEAAQMHMGNGTNWTDFDCTPVITNGQVNLTFDFRVVRPQAGVMVTNRFHTVETLESKGGILVKAADAQGMLQSNVMVLARVEIITNAAARFQTRLTQVIKRAPGDAATGSSMVAHQKIVTQLETIRLAQFMPFKEETLENVVQRLSKAIREQSTNSEGISFLITGPETNQVSRIDPATGLPVAPANPPVDARQALVHLNTPMENMKVMDILDRVVMTAVPPVKYSIADYGVVFSAKQPGEGVVLFTRTYKVDKNVFYSDLKQMGGAGAATNSSATISAMARNFFTNLGVNLDSPAGKAVFYNEGNSTLFVKATQADQDFIDRALQFINQVQPQIHIKARFLQLPKETLAIMQGTTEPTNSLGAGVVGIFSDSNFRVAFRSLSSRKDVEILGEPEVTTLSGRQCQVRATQVATVITNVTFQESGTNGTGDITYHTSQTETGPIFDVTPSVLADGYTVDLPMTASSSKFWGYPSIPTNEVTPVTATNSAGEVIALPMSWPAMQMYRSSTHVTVLDNQTVVLSLGNPEQVRFGAPDEKREAVVAKHIHDAQKKNVEKEILVFVTATIVDPAGNRVHGDEESSHFQIKAAPDSLNRAF